MSAMHREPTYVIGFDLGHGTTALASVRVDAADHPRMLELNQRTYWPTVYSIGPDGTNPVVGNPAIPALATPAGRSRGSSVYISFKYRPDIDPEAQRRLPEYAGHLLEKLRSDEAFSGDYEVILGCPSGWDDKSIEYYRKIMAPVFAKAGFDVVRESRAAMMAALEEHEEEQNATQGRSADNKPVVRDVLIDSTLVVDAGSSTLDFTFVRDRTDKPFDCGNDLGAGLLDEDILARSLDQPENAHLRDALREAMECPVCHAKMLMTCRQSKEAYFENGQSGEGASISTAKGYLGYLVPLDHARMNQILDAPLTKLGGKSWRESLRVTLAGVQDTLRREGLSPRIVILTGGASRMHFFQDEVRRAFPNTTVVVGQHPELTIARGLARWGRRRRLAERFRNAGKQVLNSHLPTTLQSCFPDYVRGLAQALAQGLVEARLVGRLRAWRAGEIGTLRQTSEKMKEDAEVWMGGEGAMRVRSTFTAKWRYSIEDILLDEIVKRCPPGSGIEVSTLKSFLPGDTRGSSLDGKGIYDADDPLGMVPNLTDVFKMITGIVAAMLAVVFIATGPLGWVIGAIALIAGIFFAHDVILDTELWMWIRQTALTDAKIEEVREKLTAAIGEKIAASLTQDPRHANELRDNLKSRIEARLEHAIDQAKLLIR